MCVCLHIHTYVCGHVCMCTYVETRRQQLARLAGQEGPEVLLSLSLNTGDTSVCYPSDLPVLGLQAFKTRAL